MAGALELLLASPTDWDDQSATALVQPIAASLPDLQPQEIDLSVCDQLLGVEAGLPEGCHVSA